MVKITNGISVFEVTEGAFASIYSKQGFVKCNEEAQDNAEANEEKDVATNDSSGLSPDDENFCKELEKKPIGQWSKVEVAKFVEINGINTEGATRLSEVKEIVKDFLTDK